MWQTDIIIICWTRLSKAETEWVNAAIFLLSIDWEKVFYKGSNSKLLEFKLDKTFQYFKSNTKYKTNYNLQSDLTA